MTNKNKRRSVSSISWLKQHFHDQYVICAKKKGLRSRAWFKLDEIQRSEKVLKPGMIVVDLGAAPGSWSQYAINKVGKIGKVIACDLLLMKPIPGVNFLQGDFRDEQIVKRLLTIIGNKEVQVIMSDMAPNLSGKPIVDIPRFISLVEIVLNVCNYKLAYDGTFIVKIFHGEGFDEYLRKIYSLFSKVKIFKPKASRVHSREAYIIATRRKI